jgi:Family of unknown function (DUF5317)
MLMSLFATVIALAVLAGYLFGGRLARFTQLQVRWWPLAPIAFALQLAPLPDGDGGIDLAIRILVFGASYAMLLAFAIKNARIAGVPIVVIGLVLNGLVVTLNGRMPVSQSALSSSGQSETLRELQDDHEEKHQLMTDDTLLSFLGDVLPIGSPINQVVSLGDAYVYAGVAWLIVAVMRGRTAGLDRPPALERYRGRHRRRSAPRREAVPAAAATRSGSEP